MASDMNIIVLSYVSSGYRRDVTITLEEFEQFDKQGCLGDILVGRCKGLIMGATGLPAGSNPPLARAHSNCGTRQFQEK